MFEQETPVLDAKGIEMVRRDQCPLVAHTQANITPFVTQTQAIIYPRVALMTSALSSLTPRQPLPPL